MLCMHNILWIICVTGKQCFGTKYKFMHIEYVEILLCAFWWCLWSRVEVYIHIMLVVATLLNLEIQFTIVSSCLWNNQNIPNGYCNCDSDGCWCYAT
jgi:hypothetical protein